MSQIKTSHALTLTLTGRWATVNRVSLHLRCGSLPITSLTLNLYTGFCFASVGLNIRVWGWVLVLLFCCY